MRKPSDVNLDTSIRGQYSSVPTEVVQEWTATDNSNLQLRLRSETDDYNEYKVREHTPCAAKHATGQPTFARTIVPTVENDMPVLSGIDSRNKAGSERLGGSTRHTPPALGSPQAHKAHSRSSASDLERISDHSNSRKGQSITPHIPAQKANKTRTAGETSSTRLSNTVTQEKTIDSALTQPEERRDLLDALTGDCNSENLLVPSAPNASAAKEKVRRLNDTTTENEIIGAHRNDVSVELPFQNEKSRSQSGFQTPPTTQDGEQLLSDVPVVPAINDLLARDVDISVPYEQDVLMGDPAPCTPPKSSGTPQSSSATGPGPTNALQLSTYLADGQEMEMAFEPTVGSSFPPDFDRGRFPAQRRRRGGKKYGTPRIKGFSNGTVVQGSMTRKIYRSPYEGVDPGALAAVPASLSVENHGYISNPQNIRDGSHPYLQGDSINQVIQTSSERANGKQKRKSMTPLHPSRKALHDDGTSANPSGSLLNANAIALQKLSLSLKEYHKLTVFFSTVLYPAIKKQKKHYQQHLLPYELSAIEESISNDLITHDLFRFLRDNEFNINRHQRKQIRRQIGRIYMDKVDIAKPLRPSHVKSLDERTTSISWPEIERELQSSASSAADNEEMPLGVVNEHGPGPASPSVVYAKNAPALPTSTSNMALFENGRRYNTTESFTTETRPKIPGLIGEESSPSQRRLSRDNSIQIPSAISREPHGVRPEEVIRSSTDLLNSSFSQRERRIDAPMTAGTLRVVHPQPLDDSRVLLSKTNRSEGRIPRTLFDAELEKLIAEAALCDPAICKSGAISKCTITIEDQRRLLSSSYVSKAVHSVTPTDDKPRSAKFQLTAIQARVTDPVSKPIRQLPAMLRHREFGSGFGQQNDLRLRVAERLQPWKQWKGASSDIVTVAWAPDSMKYAIGAAAHTNAEDLQYNRPCNLLCGELSSNSLWELPDHRTMRPKPSEILEGPNSIQGTYDACDPIVYQTVNSVMYSPSGDRMYTASRDHTVKVWDNESKKPTCLYTLDHGAIVTGVNVAHSQLGVFATASKSIEKSVRVYYGMRDEDTTPDPIFFSSSRAEARPSVGIFPECIHWGPTAHTNHLLLAGFTQWEALGRDDRAREGQLCLWDVDACQHIKVTPSSQSVTAAVWHPFLPYFATGGAPGGNLLSNRHSTKTVVRTWDLRSPTRFAMEYECPAIDMQDVTFHPLDTNIVTAGCTDGTSFVWDFRWPETPLHRLRHGRSLMELDPNRTRAEADTGVCLSLWGLEGSLYYSGSSDGIVKAWDIRRHPADVHVRDIAQVGAAIQNGAFSPDFTHLLVGDSDGAIHILSSAPCESKMSDDNSDDEHVIEEQIRLIRAADASGKRLDPLEQPPDTDGTVTAKELVQSGQLEIHPSFGPGKGPNYQGPYAKDKRKNTEDGSIGRLRKRYDRQQVFTRRGIVNEARASYREEFVATRKAWLDDKRRESAISEQNGPGEHAKGTSRSGFLPSAKDRVSSLNRPKVVDSGYTTQNHQFSRGKAKSLNAAQDCSQKGANHAISKLVRDPVTISNTAPEIATHRTARRSTATRDQGGAIDNLIPESEMVEQNFWWPRMGEEEIKKALARSG